MQAKHQISHIRRQFLRLAGILAVLPMFGLGLFRNRNGWILLDRDR